MLREHIHSMKRRSPTNNYQSPGIYHITITVRDRALQRLGVIRGDVNCADDHPDAPRVELTTIGRMVEYELLHSITHHYPVIEVQDYVIMPDHIHFIVVVKNTIINKSGRTTHLGQVVAGFKKGCNRRYWEITGQEAPSAASSSLAVGGQSSAAFLSPAVPPQGKRTPSSASTGRQPLFDYGYVDVMPLKEGQLETQRAYIRANPRNRLLRMTHATSLRPQRAIADTLITLPALRGYLVREHALRQDDQQTWEAIQSRLLINNGHVSCDGYGNRLLLERRLLPVVCHRKDRMLFHQQKQACVDAAAKGAILVSARIAKGEQEIIDEISGQGHPVITVADNGFPEIYHPSQQRLDLAAANKLLILSPWKYQYRHHNEDITVAQCKTMNCVVQALCKKKDTWWKEYSK